MVRPHTRDHVAYHVERHVKGNVNSHIALTSTTPDRVHVLRIGSVIINGIQNETRVGMLRDFIRSHDLDISLLQEVTEPQSVNTPE